MEPNLQHDDLLRNGSVRIAVVGTLAILALFLFVETAQVATNIGRPANPATDTITVTGSGKATAAPDIATIDFTVMKSSPTVAAAQEAVTTQTNDALAYLKQQGIADKDIRTTSYTISPEYAYPQPCLPGSLCPAYVDSSPRITGYQVSHSIEVKVRDLDTVGALLGGLGEQGVQNLYGPNFALDNPTAGADAARADAIANAKQEAQILAAQLGVRLGRIVNFSESPGYYPYPVAYGKGGATADSAATPPSVPSGENEYDSTVSITYEIR